jgi:uncharacterized protein
VGVRGGVGVSPMVGAADACDARGDDLPRGTTVTTCTTCGASLESTATTCPVCSAPVPAPDATSGTASAPSPDPTSGTGAGPAWAPPPSGPGGAAGTGEGEGWWPPPGSTAPVWTETPHPSGLPSDVRNWGLAAHLSAYVGAWVALAFLGPLVVWLIKRDEHPFIDHHAKEALNFNLSFLLYGIVGGVLAVPIGLLTLGIGLIPIVIVAAVLLIAWLILPILAAVRAANGEGYRYPFTIRFIS